MARTRTHPPLSVLQNNRLVGRLLKEPSGAVSFTYDESWLDWPNAWPVSLSLPLRPTPYKGEPVIAVFDNLLPDSDAIRRRVAERVGAAGVDAYSLLAAIGRDCVGAMQFMPEGETPAITSKVSGEPVDEAAIEAILKGLAHAPLGLDRDNDFRVSVAGAQEKTALLLHDGRWLKPHGTIPTTHILKTQIGALNGVNLSNSVENEFYCLKLVKAFGNDVCNAEMVTFGETKALVIERFDRLWRDDGVLLRLPQEDCCQALGVPSSRKYENEGGPGIVPIMELLKGSNDPEVARIDFFEAQVLFWLMGATDGHAKNFSVRLFPGGAFNLAPLYDVLSLQPMVDEGRIGFNQMKLAMGVGDNRHYRVDTIHGRHFLQSAAASGLPKRVAALVLGDVRERAEGAMAEAASALPADFPHALRESIEAGIRRRLQSLALPAT
jgi:serine/threonine-protein kinase HipA